MRRTELYRGVLLALLGVALTLTAGADIRVIPSSTAPKLVAVAETKLVMVGITQANFQGLERNLKEKPADDEAWTFIRGQALLVAESANLLMMRPPHNDGQTVWMQRATEMREAAATLGRYAADRDYEKSQAALANLANTCTRCHQTFRGALQIAPGPDKAVPQLEKIGPPKGLIKGNRDTE